MKVKQNIDRMSIIMFALFLLFVISSIICVGVFEGSILLVALLL